MLDSGIGIYKYTLMVVHKRGSETGGFSALTVADAAAAAAAVNAIGPFCRLSPRDVVCSVQLAFGVIKTSRRKLRCVGLL